MPSPATEFQNRLKGVRRLVILDKSLDTGGIGLPTPRNRRLVQELRYACTILPVAYFEDFLRLLIADFVDKLSSYRPAVPWPKLPDKLRATLVFESPRVISRWKKQLSEAEMLRVYEELASPGRPTGQYTICKDTISELHTSSSSEQIAQLARKIGVKGVFQKLSQPLTRYSVQYKKPIHIEGRIDDIVSARDRAAHGRLTSFRSRGDIEQDIEFLEHLAKALQTVVDKHRSEIAASRRQRRTRQP